MNKLDQAEIRENFEKYSTWCSAFLEWALAMLFWMEIDGKINGRMLFISFINFKILILKY